MPPFTKAPHDPSYGGLLWAPNTYEYTFLEAAAAAAAAPPPVVRSTRTHIFRIVIIRTLLGGLVCTREQSVQNGDGWIHGIIYDKPFLEAF